MQIYDVLLVPRWCVSARKYLLCGWTSRGPYRTKAGVPLRAAHSDMQQMQEVRPNQQAVDQQLLLSTVQVQVSR